MYLSRHFAKAERSCPNSLIDHDAGRDQSLIISGGTTTVCMRELIASDAE
jgi:hypothetical protein